MDYLRTCVVVCGISQRPFPNWCEGWARWGASGEWAGLRSVSRLRRTAAGNKRKQAGARARPFRTFTRLGGLCLMTWLYNGE